MIGIERLTTSGAIALCLAAAALGATCAPALASHQQVAMFQDPGVVSNPAGTLAQLRGLGADHVRMFMMWDSIAPRPRSHRRPTRFRAADPSSYPASAWAPWDNSIKQAQRAGIVVNLDVAGGAPLWATGPGAPRSEPHPDWEPNAAEYGAFVHAVGERYSGDYDPRTHRLDPGNPNDLPGVDFWSVWNEPDYGPSLAPQGLPGRLSIEHSPWMYRQLLDAAWGALQRTGHGRDTILFGEVAPRGYPPVGGHGILPWGLFSGMKPLNFLRVLYCVDARYRPLTGAAAAVRGCPTTAAGRRDFRVRHPALFEASGFADHPYSRWYRPNIERPNDPDYSSLADLGRLERALDRLQRVYGSRRRLPIWNTEYGYLTSPPKHPTRTIPYVSPTTAAAYLNQAEYMSWRDPRVMSFMQYLLTDPLAPSRANNYGGFASGLINHDGRQKATYSAWRLPLYLPRTSTRRGRGLEVWGCARPLFFALEDLPSDPERVEIQFAGRSSGSFTTVKTVNLAGPRGYFDTSVNFSTSGTVRLSWRYPPDDPQLPAGTIVYSRDVQVTVR